MNAKQLSTPKKPILSQLYKILLKREHSIKEITAALKKMNYLDSEIEPVVKQAQKEGFINESRLVENFIRYKSERGYGPCRIEMMLLEKGLDEDLITQLMPDYDYWEQIAKKIRVKKFGDDFPDDYAEQAKQMRFLQYRGFETEHIKSVFKKS